MSTAGANQFAHFVPSRGGNRIGRWDFYLNVYNIKMIL